MLLTLESLSWPITAVPGTPVDAYQAYLSAGTTFGELAPQGSGTGIVYGTFNGDSKRQLLPFVDTDLVYPGANGQMGDPGLLRYFYGVRFLGSGTLFVRAFTDKTLVQTGYVTLDEDPNQASIFKLPNGTAGYGLRLQWCGLATMRMYILDWDPATEEGS